MPATVQNTLLSSAVPVQPGPGSCYRASATNVSLPAGLNFPAFSQGESLDPIDLNYAVVDLANLARFGGMGCGVGTGLGLTSASGLTVSAAAGIAVGPGGLIELPVGGSLTVSDAATNYVWLTTTGGLVSSTSLTVPTGGAVYLGAAVASSGTVTTIETSGIVSLSGGRPVRATADVGYPVDTPSFPMLARTGAGSFEWDGAVWRALGTPTRTLTMGGTVTLAGSSAPRQVLDPVSGTKKVLVPSSRIRDGVLEIHHSGAAGTIDVRDSGDTTTLISLTTGLRAVLYPSYASGAAYPTATAV